jgi:hypothetical protein
VHVGEEVDSLVVEGLQKLPVPVRVFGLQARNHILDLSDVADMAAQAPGALQDEAGLPPGLILFHQDCGLLEVGPDIGSCLVELRLALIHNDMVSVHGSSSVLQTSIPSCTSLTTPSACGAMSPLGELDGAVQFEAPDLGDKDLDGCLFVRFLVRHPLPREGRDGTGPVKSPSALRVIPVEVAQPDREVHLLPLYRDLAGNERVPAFLGRDLHRLVDYDLGGPVVETRVTSTADNLLGF